MMQGALVLCALVAGALVLVRGIDGKLKNYVPLSEIKPNAGPKTPPPEVQLGSGAVRGTTIKTNQGRPIFAFQGIPYARPPVGKHRFKDPKPVRPWPGVWDATRYGSPCLQYERIPTDQLFGDEDCLYVNVYTPQLPQPGKALMDVLVFIHGGGFTFGSGDPMGPEILLDKDIVFVTFNYRLGPLGFLSTEDEVLPGNMGLKDQSMALRWVQGNIAAFGGNPNSVTLSGLSAGGVSVHYHYLSPLSKGLFQRGWSLSGTALNSWAVTEGAAEKAKKMGDMLGCPTNSSRELVDCLRHRPARALVSRVRSFQDHLQQPFTPFGPVVEPQTVLNAFIDRPPIEVIQSGGAQDLPWVTGVTTEEGLFPLAEFIDSKIHFLFLEMRWLEVAPLLLDFNHTAENKDAISSAAKQKYLGKEMLSPDNAKAFIDMVGDRIFKSGAELAAREMAAANKQPVYFYEFGYRGKNSYSTFMSGGEPTNWGVSHADDLPYVIDWELLPSDETAADVAVSELMVHIWSTFIRTGIPTGPAGSPGWAPLNPAGGDLHMMRIGRDGKLSFATVPQLNNTDFWMSLGLKENVPLPKTEAHEEL